MKLKLHLLLFYPSTWYICDFFLFHIEIEGKGGWIIGGGANGMMPPPLSNYWVGGLGPLYLRLWFTESNDTCILASYISN